MSSPSRTHAPRYRDALPQLDRTPFLTDGGIETTLIFHDGLDLPHFAAYDLLTRDGGEDALRRYFEPYVAIAASAASGSSSRRRPGARTRTGRSGSATRRRARRAQPARGRAGRGDARRARDRARRRS